MNDKLFGSAPGNLMYVQVCTRPNIAFIVDVQSNLGNDHWIVAKKVMRYLQKTKDYILVYRRVDNLEVVGYTNLDLGGCLDDRDIFYPILKDLNQYFQMNRIGNRLLDTSL